LHGMTSVHVLRTATSGRSRSASRRPVALSIALAGLAPVLSSFHRFALGAPFRGQKKAPVTVVGCGGQKRRDWKN
jgi:hypothetical protein